jgi:hypothetical protein
MMQKSANAGTAISKHSAAPPRVREDFILLQPSHHAGFGQSRHKRSRRHVARVSDLFPKGVLFVKKGGAI